MKKAILFNFIIGRHMILIILSSLISEINDLSITEKTSIFKSQ